MDNATLAAQLKRLNRLSREELSALSDRDRKANPNAVHLASALVKLNDPDEANYPARVHRWRR